MEKEAAGQTLIRSDTGHTLAEVYRAHRKCIGELLAEVRLHAGREVVLIELWEYDGLRGDEHAVRLGVGAPTVTKMLRSLENCSLTKRR